MKLSPQQPDRPDDGPTLPTGNARLNLLLSYGGWREGTVVDQLPQLLSPMGILSIRVCSGEEAAEVIQSTSVHIALVDLEMPLQREQPRPNETAGGARTLKLLQRLDQPPPTVVVRPRQPDSPATTRGLVDALREGAFAVLDRPLDMEVTLEVMRRILRRYYSDVWPC